MAIFYPVIYRNTIRIAKNKSREVKPPEDDVINSQCHAVISCISSNSWDSYDASLCRARSVLRSTAPHGQERSVMESVSFRARSHSHILTARRWHVDVYVDVLCMCGKSSQAMTK